MNEQIQLTDFSVTLGNGVSTKPVTCSLHAGESLAILGPTGCGKTSFLKAIAGLAPFSGTLTVLNHTWHHPTPHPQVANLEMIYPDIGFTFEKNALFEWWTVEENITLPTPLRHMHVSYPKTSLSPEVILTQIGLWKDRHKYPRQLSGGMRKRLAIARALIRRPQILICDSPLAGLDPLSALSVFALLQDAIHTHRATMLVSLHTRAVAQDHFSHVVEIQGC